MVPGAVVGRPEADLELSSGPGLGGLAGRRGPRESRGSECAENVRFIQTMRRLLLVEAFLERLVVTFSSVLDTRGAVCRRSSAVWAESSPAWAARTAFGGLLAPFWSPLGTDLRLS
eukprot:4169212-Pyramimonas_sp.AAC.1